MALRGWLTGAVLAALATGPAMTGGAAEPPHRLRIAFLAAGAQNGFNQSVWQGVQEEAARLGDVEVRLFDGGFNSTLQYNQVEDVVASRQYDGVVLYPNDSTSIASAVANAAKAGIRTVAVQFPIGPDLNSLEPQVEGVVATVAAPPAAGARLQAEDLAQWCQPRPQCNVVIVIGQKVYPFDLLRYRTYQEVLGRYPNIRIRATIEGDYDAATSMGGMLDILQVDRHVDAVLSNADIQTIGVEMALKSYGIDPGSLYLAGGGGSGIAIAALRQGRWAATYGVVPASMGAKALEALVRSLRGETVEPAIDADTLSPLPPIWTRSMIQERPDFKAQWAG